MTRPAFISTLIAGAWTIADASDQIARYVPESIVSGALWTDEVAGGGRNLTQGTGANEPVVTTLAGLPAVQVGMVSAVRRQFASTLPAGNLQDTTIYVVAQVSPADNTARALYAVSATAELQMQGMGTGDDQAGVLVSMPAAAASRSEPPLPDLGAQILTFQGDASKRTLFIDNLDTFFGVANASTSHAFSSFTLGNAATPSDAKSCDAVVGLVIVTDEDHVEADRKRVHAAIVNLYEGAQILTHGNSQTSTGHVTTLAQSFQWRLRRHVDSLIYCSGYSVGGKQTPQQITDFPGQVVPQINYLMNERFYVWQEGENDLYTNGASGTAGNVTYAQTTARDNVRDLSRLARAACIGTQIAIPVPPTTAVGTPANYENSRLDLNAYLLTCASYIYDPLTDTIEAVLTPVVDAATGKPYFDFVIDAFGPSSPIGTIASLTASGYYEPDEQHLNDDGVDLLAEWTGGLLNQIIGGFVPGAPSLLPEVDSVNYSVVDTAGGTTLIIVGENLTGGSVTYGGTACTNVSVGIGGTTITFDVPAKAAGTLYDLVVTTAEGSATLTAACESWRPTTTSGLQLWLRADMGVTGTSTVDQWDDQSGNNRDFTATSISRPALNTTGLNGLPSIDFDGVNDTMYSTAPLSDLITNSASTAILVYEITSYINNSAPYNTDSVISQSAAYWGISHKTSGPSVQFYIWDGADRTRDVIGPAAPGDVIAVHRHFGGNVYGSVNGSAENSGVSGNVQVLTGTMALGSANGGANTFANIRLAEVIVYNTDIGDADVARAKGYANSRYGVY